MSWWAFVDAEAQSPAYRKHLPERTQALVALQPQRGSARPIGQIYVQLVLDQIEPTRMEHPPSTASGDGTVVVHRGRRRHRDGGVRPDGGDGRAGRLAPELAGG